MDRESLTHFYQLAFTRGQTASIGGKHLRFSVIRAGLLHLPSGQIVACDPLVGHEREPFVQAVLPGRYPVDLSLGHDEAGDVERIVFARLLFTKNKPVVWVKALRESEANLTAEDDEPFGFLPASGTAAFMDKETAELFRLDSIDELDQILDDLVANYHPERNWFNHQVDDRHNMIMFSPGRSAGICPTYFAIDDAGDVCLALTKLYQ
jgi:hypothetical protein